MTTFMSLPMVTRASLAGTFLSGHVAASDQRFPLAVEEAFLLSLKGGVSAEDLKRLEPATKGSNENVFASLSLHARSCYATFSREDRTRYSQGQFYTHPQPDKILWFQRIRPADGFAEHRTEGMLSTAVRTPEPPGASHDLACLTDTLRIFLDQRALSCASVHPLTCTLDRCLPTSSDPTSCQLPSSALLDRSLVARFFEWDFWPESEPCGSSLHFSAIC